MLLEETDLLRRHFTEIVEGLGIVEDWLCTSVLY